MATNSAASIRRINPPELGTPPGYSQVVDVRAGRIIFIAGQTALDQDGKLVGKNDFVSQARQVFHNLNVALQSAGCTAANLVKMTVFLREMGNLQTYRDARNHFFSTTTPPAAPAITLVEVSKLYGPDFLIEIEAIAAVRRSSLQSGYWREQQGLSEPFLFGGTVEPRRRARRLSRWQGERRFLMKLLIISASAAVALFPATSLPSLPGNPTPARLPPVPISSHYLQS